MPDIHHSSAARVCVVALLGLVLAGCAAPQDRTNWVNPDVPEDQWSLDRAACRQQAEEQAARQLDRDLAASENVSGGGGTGMSSLSRQFAVDDARDLRRRLYTNCLSGRGYTPQRR